MTDLLADDFDDLLAERDEDPPAPDEIGDAVEVAARLREGFTGARAAFSIHTDGVESRVALDLGDVPLEFGEESAEMIGSTATLDDALQLALGAQGAVIMGDALAGDAYMVYAWPETAGLSTPVTLMVDASRDICALVIGGTAFFPADPAERTVRWVSVPGMMDYYGLDADLQGWLRDPMQSAWARAAKKGGLPEVPLGIEAVSFPTLRLLIASHPDVVPVKSVTRKGTDRGGVVYGVTRAFLTRDMVEPEVYLPVISMKEGNVDAINAWDLNAGVSLGPVQVNVINGHLFDILGRVWDEDPELFEACFGALGWQMEAVDGRPALVVDDGAETLYSQKRETRDDIVYNAGYFQSGTAGKSGLSQIDGDFRRDLTARFRNLVLWPHVQTWLMQASANFLGGGQRRLSSSNIDGLDADFDHDTFVLRALLMSGFVRYSASLKYTLQHVPDGASKSQLGALPRALDKVAGKSDAWAERIARLKKRYFGSDGKGGQTAHAERVYGMRS